METFDQALKYLAQKNPADFIGYALGEARERVLEPLPSGLLARGRDVDGCYLAQVNGLLAGWCPSASRRAAV